MQIQAYEKALRGHQTMQPLRNDALRGFSGSKEFFTPAGIILAGLGLVAIKQQGINFNNKVMMTGGAFVTGWLLGGGAISL
jgi:hypothetical protein